MYQFMMIKPIPGLILLISSAGLAWAEHGSTDVAGEVLNRYVQIQSSLADDSDKGVKEAAQEIVKLTSGQKDRELVKIGTAARKLAGAKDLAAFRKELKSLSKPVVQWVEKNKPEGLAVAYCPMAGAKWVQKKGDIRNPYYGKEMLECGEFQKT